jgi:hypothetical protein
MVVVRATMNNSTSLLDLEPGQLRWPNASRDGTDDTGVSHFLDDSHGGRNCRFLAREQAWQSPFDGVGNLRVLGPWSGVTRLRCARQTSPTVPPALLNNVRVTAAPACN